MITSTIKDIGRSVVYNGNKYPGGQREVGVITSFNEHYVFIRYSGDQTVKATRRRDLEWDVRYDHDL